MGKVRRPPTDLSAFLALVVLWAQLAPAAAAAAAGDWTPLCLNGQIGYLQLSAPGEGPAPGAPLRADDACGACAFGCGAGAAPPSAVAGPAAPRAIAKAAPPTSAGRLAAAPDKRGRCPRAPPAAA